MFVFNVAMFDANQTPTERDLMTRTKSLLLSLAALVLGASVLAGAAEAALPPPSQCRPGVVCGTPLPPPPPKPNKCSITQHCDNGTISCSANKTNSNICSTRTSVSPGSRKGRGSKLISIECVSVDSKGRPVYTDTARCSVSY
jgi:hypothetical protein